MIDSRYKTEPTGLPSNINVVRGYVEPGTEYFFRVYAENTAGKSAPRLAMERDVLYTVSALEEPRNPLCVECTRGPDGVFRLSWTPGQVS